MHINGNYLAEVHLERGVKQGSPLSALLFQLATDDAQHALINDWELRGFGVALWHGTSSDQYAPCNWEALVGIMFADEETLVATDLAELQVMIQDVANAFATVGLTIGLSKNEWMSTDDTDEWETLLAD